MSLKNNNDLSPKLLSATKLALVVLVLSASGIFLYFFQPSWLKINFNKADVAVVTPVNIASSTATSTCSDCVRRLLDGTMVKPELAALRPFAVMIDNFPAARPQSGLSAASIVYEAPAEGGITRYLAVFAPDQAPSDIGPIRSARVYFLNWAEELGATYVHVGGSPEALDLAKSLGKSNLDQFFNSAYFWRSDSRLAPHNVLTSGTDLNRYRTDKTETGSELTAWQFKDSATSTAITAPQINIKYTNGYAVYWQYQADTNSYSRYLDDQAHLDASGAPIIAKNIIVHLTSFKVTDDKLRLDMSTALSGQALLCQDGACQMGLWKKNSSSSRAKYYYKSGEEFIFNAGVTWIEVIDDLKNLKY